MTMTLRCRCGTALRRTQPRPGTVIWVCVNQACMNAPRPVEVEVHGAASPPQVWCPTCVDTIIDPVVQRQCVECAEGRR